MLYTTLGCRRYLLFSFTHSNLFVIGCVIHMGGVISLVTLNTFASCLDYNEHKLAYTETRLRKTFGIFVRPLPTQAGI